MVQFPSWFLPVSAGGESMGFTVEIGAAAGDTAWAAFDGSWSSGPTVFTVGTPCATADAVMG
jgi:hypothetical protein